jgi:hypothetical protein
VTPVVFDDPASLPEVDAAALDADILGRAIEVRGALIIRNLVPRAAAAALDETTQRVFAAIDAKRREKDLYEPSNDPDIAATHKFIADVGCGLMVNSPVALAETMAAYEKYGVIDLLTRQLGERPVLSSKKATLRRTSPRFKHSDVWHQDGAFMGGDLRVTNVWLALTDCGVTSASVELAAKRFNEVIKPDYGVAVTADMAAKLSPVTVSPICAAGDALMFDHLCLHRTAMSPAYVEERRALETWFFAPSFYPHDYDSKPVVI